MEELRVVHTTVLMLLGSPSTVYKFAADPTSAALPSKRRCMECVRLNEAGLSAEFSRTASKSCVAGVLRWFAEFGSILQSCRRYSIVWADVIVAVGTPVLPCTKNGPHHQLFL